MCSSDLTGGQEIDLSLATIDGIGFAFAPGSVIGPNAVWVLANGTATNLWKERYPSARLSGVFPGTLSNGGERLTLRDRNGNALCSVHYGDNNGWPAAADGDGMSLELRDPNGDPDAPSSWRASASKGGTPGLPPAPAALASVR